MTTVAEASLVLLGTPDSPAVTETFHRLRRRNGIAPHILLETGTNLRLTESQRRYEIAHRKLQLALVAQPGMWARIRSGVPSMAWRYLRKARLPSRVRLLRRWGEAQGVSVTFVDKLSSPEAVEILHRWGSRIGLLCGSQWLVREPLLSADLPVVNVHPGKLPEHRALDAAAWSVLAGDPVGVTSHLVDEGIDTGPIISFHPIDATRHDSLFSLWKEMLWLKPVVFLDAVEKLSSQGFGPTPQKPDRGEHHHPMTVAELLSANDRLRTGYVPADEL